MTDWMVGTDGGLDYMVVARSGGIALGFKPLCAVEVGANEAHLSFGFRYRSAQDPDVDTKPLAPALVAAWPTLVFEKLGKVRASSMMMVETSLAGDPAEAFASFKELLSGDEVREAFRARIALAEVVEESMLTELLDHAREKWLAGLRASQLHWEAVVAMQQTAGSSASTHQPPDHAEPLAPPSNVLPLFQPK